MNFLLRKVSAKTTMGDDRAHQEVVVATFDLEAGKARSQEKSEKQFL